jgi:hypothetical protein
MNSIKDKNGLKSSKITQKPTNEPLIVSTLDKSLKRTNQNDSSVSDKAQNGFQISNISSKVNKNSEENQNISQTGSLRVNSTIQESQINFSLMGEPETDLLTDLTPKAENKTEGAGRINSEDYVYYGQISQSKFNGYGRVIKRNFALYEGCFFENRREGYGVEIYANSDIYIGEFMSDRKNGLGIYLFSTGGYYYGFFEKNLRDGFGTLYNRSNRQTFTGYWRKDLRNGRGVEFYKNGSKYDGFFENDKRHGVGFMEYSKSLIYIGEWNAGKRDGLGKVEQNKKTVSGKFKDDLFLEPLFFNSKSHADILLLQTSSKTVEEFLRDTDYKLKRTIVRGIGNIYVVLKESLVAYVLSLVDSSILRLNCYLKLKNIFSKSSRFEYVMEDILMTLKYEPNSASLSVYWDPVLREILINKQDFSWQKRSLDINVNNLIFDETQDKTEKREIQFGPTDETIQLIVTNELAIAKYQNFEAEGILNNEGFTLRYYKAATSEWESTATVRIFPFFLMHEDSKLKSILNLKLNHYTGEFYFGKDNFSPRTFSLFLALDQEGIWYSVGVDSVGSFVMAGQMNKATSTGQILQKYFNEYLIEYELFLATTEKLQGLWRTTNLGGHFVLRRDNSFRMNSEIATIMNEYLDIERKESKVMLDDIEELDFYMESSILSVIVKGVQGGIPEFLDKTEEIAHMELFEKFKKLQDVDNSVVPETKKKPVKASSKQKKTDKNKSFKKLEVSKKTEEISEIPKKVRASLALINLHAVDKIATHDLKELNLKHNSILKNDFKDNLTLALRDLKQVVENSIGRSVFKFDHNKNENISWVGNFITLGREEQVVFDNLYIIGDIIEGIFTDVNEVSYEMAGSYSSKTKEFEIVGMSFDKNKSIKFKGELTNFKLRGVMTKKPANGPSSNVEIKLLGHESKAVVHLLSSGVIYENLESTFKLTKSYLYGMILFQKDYIFLNGFKDKDSGFGLEINSTNKLFKNNLLIQVNEKACEKEELSLYEKKLIFQNEDMEIILFY